MKKYYISHTTRVGMSESTGTVESFDTREDAYRAVVALYDRDREDIASGWLHPEVEIEYEVLGPF